ncbi:non-canonical purine NTP pyrophosphatase [Sulfolobales archaeon HS-7]|nr:non-canonical purine NTP pyrophosphatase [Sulfolobales archaeon HS-7]
MRRGEISLITSNKGKAEEIIHLSRAYGIALRWINYSKPEIQAEELEDVVRFGCSVLRPSMNKPFILEDAGLFINALSGFPGPYTSYAYKTIGTRGVLKLMKGERDRTASFKSVICLADENDEKLFVGAVTGVISEEVRGSGGFGFDPVFIPEGEKITFAEMDLEEKNRISHRARSFSQLVKYLLYGQ